MSKMRGHIGRWGHCIVPGHGKWCSVGQDIGRRTREDDKREAKVEIEADLWDLPNGDTGVQVPKYSVTLV